MRMLPILVLRDLLFLLSPEDRIFGLYIVELFLQCHTERHRVVKDVDDSFIHGLRILNQYSRSIIGLVVIFIIKLRVLAVLVIVVVRQVLAVDEQLLALLRFLSVVLLLLIESLADSSALLLV